MRSYLLILFLLLCFNTVSFSQIPEEVFVSLSVLDQNRLEKAALEFEEAKVKMEQVISYYQNIPRDSSSNVEMRMEMETEALKKLYIASNMFNEASQIAYNVYNSGCQEFWKEQEKLEHHATGLKKAEYMQYEAKTMMREANALRANVSNTSQFEKGLAWVNNATKKEILAIRYEGRALQIYQDFPIEYDYGWENDIDIEFVLAELERQRKERNEKLFGAPKKTEVKKEPKQKPEPEPEPEPEIPPVTFRIQVAAHINKIEPEDLQRIYSGEKEVEEVVEDGWYKYQFGSYETFGQANIVLEEINVSKAFIVAYQEGKKLSIRQAKKIAP